METAIHTSNGIRTHDPSVRAGEESHTLDRAATVIGYDMNTVVILDDTEESTELVRIGTLVTCILELPGPIPPGMSIILNQDFHGLPYSMQESE
jgi:hypothetical protein